MLDVSLPESMTAFVKDQVARRGYRDAAEYIGSLVEADRQAQLRVTLEQKLLETVDGPFADFDEKDLEDVRRVGKAFLAERSSP